MLCEWYVYVSGMCVSGMCVWVVVCECCVSGMCVSGMCEWYVLWCLCVCEWRVCVCVCLSGMCCGVCACVCEWRVCVCVSGMWCVSACATSRYVCVVCGVCECM